MTHLNKDDSAKEIGKRERAAKQENDRVGHAFGIKQVCYRVTKEKLNGARNQHVCRNKNALGFEGLSDSIRLICSKVLPDNRINGAEKGKK